MFLDGLDALDQKIVQLLIHNARIVTIGIIDAFAVLVVSSKLSVSIIFLGCLDGCLSLLFLHYLFTCGYACEMRYIKCRQDYMVAVGYYDRFGLFAAGRIYGSVLSFAADIIRFTGAASALTAAITLSELTVLP